MQDLLARDRRSAILGAAERRFARVGFHRATMQDVAAEASMSVGNLYRYFPSKDAIVAAMAECDRAEFAADFAHLAEAPDFFAAFAALGRRHLGDHAKQQAVMTLEIWAEASRNPGVAETCAAMERAMRAHVVQAFAIARERGLVAPHVDLGLAAGLMVTLGDGLVRRRALDPDFDTEGEIALAVAVIRTALEGGLAAAASPLPSRAACGGEQLSTVAA